MKRLAVILSIFIATYMLWSVDVTFNVNMNYQITLGNFDPTSDFVDVAGSFNSWSGSGAMNDSDEDGIYSQTISDFTIDENIEFKFRINGTDWESVDNRTYTVIEGENSVDVWYNDQPAPSGQPATITFIVNDSGGQTHAGFYLKGSWDVNGVYDSSWGGGAEHTQFYDDATHGDETAGDHIFTVQQNLVSDNGANSWQWGVNDENHSWLDGNWAFTVVDTASQTLTYTVPFGTMQDVDVVFTVDMSVQGDVTSTQLAGDFTGWGNNPIEMTDIGDGLWTTTVTFPTGSNYNHEYKFIKNSSDWESINNRQFTIDDNQELQNIDVVYFNDEAPAEETSQDVTVTFKVYMGGLNSDEYINGVSLQGSQLPLTWNAGETPMIDNNGDLVYEISVLFPAGTPLDVEYKYTRNDNTRAWQWETINNRVFTIDDSDSTQTLEIDLFDNNLPAPNDLTISVQRNQSNSTEATLNWTKIPGASTYKVFYCEYPYDTYIDITAQGNLQPNLTTVNFVVEIEGIATRANNDKAFFYVTSVK